MSDDLKKIWEKVDASMGPQRMETEAEHIARDMREGNFPKRSDPIQVPVDLPLAMTHLTDEAVKALLDELAADILDHGFDEDGQLMRHHGKLARALLDARAELAATQTQLGDWIVRADEVNVKVETLEAELAVAHEKGMDEAADKILDWLAKAVGAEKYSPCDGSESWDGDVHGTIYAILKAGGVYDDEDGRVAHLADAAAAVALVVERAGQKARLWAESYPQSSDGRNTLIMYAEWIEELAPDAGTAELAKLRGEIGRLRAIIRVNGLRAGATDAEIDALLYPKS